MTVFLSQFITVSCNQFPASAFTLFFPYKPSALSCGWKLFSHSLISSVSFVFICVGSYVAKGKEKSHSWETNIGRGTWGLVFELAFTFLFQTKKTTENLRQQPLIFLVDLCDKYFKLLFKHFSVFFAICFSRPRKVWETHCNFLSNATWRLRAQHSRTNLQGNVNLLKIYWQFKI